MLKIKHNGMLVLGLNNKELKMLKRGAPLLIKLDDVGLKGQRVAIIHGETNEVLARMGEDIGERMEKVDAAKDSVLILPDRFN